MLGGVWDSLLPSAPTNSSWGLPRHVEQHAKRKAHAGVGGMPVNPPRFDTHKKMCIVLQWGHLTARIT